MTPELVFAVGDVHGRLDLVRAALDAIADFQPQLSRRLIFLGDYVDRGPHARGVVELLMSMSHDPSVVCLKGNHERIMLDALVNGTTETFEFWRRMGGRETLASYGASDIESALERVPASHLSWMMQLPLTSGDGHRIYVHAGLRPGTPLHEQDETACLWIRERFFKGSQGEFGAHIVHGHTPTWEGKPDPCEPELLPHRTNLDLGAYATNSLGVGVFDGARPGGPVAVLAIEKPPESASQVRVIRPEASAASTHERQQARRRWPRWSIRA